MPKLSKLTNRLRLSKRDVEGMDSILGEAKTTILGEIAEYFFKLKKDLGFGKQYTAQQLAPEVTAPTPQPLEGQDNPPGYLGGEGSKVEQLLSQQTVFLKAIVDQLSQQNKTQKDAKELQEKQEEDKQESEEEKSRGVGMLGAKSEDGTLMRWLKKGFNDLVGPLLGLGAAFSLLKAGIMIGAAAISYFAEKLKGSVDDIVKFIDTLIHPGKVIAEVEKSKEGSQKAQAEREHIKDLEKQAAAGDEKAKAELEKYTPGARKAIDKQADKKYFEGLNINVPEKIQGLYEPSGDQRLTQIHARLGDTEHQPAWIQKWTHLFSHGEEHAQAGRDITDLAEYNKDALSKIHHKVSQGVPGASAAPEPMSNPQPVAPTGATEVANTLKSNVTQAGAGMSAAAQESVPKGPSLESMHADINKIMVHEKFRPEPYWDPEGQTSTFSIGYGTRIDSKSDHPELAAVYGTPGKTKKKISESEARTLLQEKVSQVEDAIKENVKVPINQKMFNALTSFGYNVGVDALSERHGKHGSQLMTKLNARDYKGAFDELTSGEKWQTSDGVFIPGLYNRRVEEQKEAREGIAELNAPAPPELMPGGSDRGERIAAAANENALSAVNPKGGSAAPVIIAPSTSVQSNQTSMMLPVDVNNGEDTHLWATRENYTRP